MTIRPAVQVESIRGGTAARAIAIGLACHNRDGEVAVASLAYVVRIWARALADEGDLESVLADRSVDWDHDGDGIAVVPVVTRVTD